MDCFFIEEGPPAGLEKTNWKENDTGKAFRNRSLNPWATKEWRYLLEEIGDRSTTDIVSN